MVNEQIILGILLFGMVFVIGIGELIYGYRDKILNKLLGKEE